MIKTIFFTILVFFSSAQAKDFKTVKTAVKKLAPSKSKSLKLEEYAFWIHTYAEKYQIDPYLMLALIKVESDFNQSAVSNTGDYSLAQINYDVWKRELGSKGIKLDMTKLKNNHSYAIEKMAIILKLLKTRHSHKDKLWYGRYHSNTKKYKSRYLKKVNLALNEIFKSRSIAQVKR